MLRRFRRTVKRRGGAALAASAMAYLTPIITSKLTEKATEFAGFAVNKLAGNTKQAFEAMAESKESWKMFGDGSETSREEMQQLLASDRPWSVVQTAIRDRFPDINGASLKLVEAINYVSGTPSTEVAMNIAERFADTTDYLKKTSYVAPGLTMEMLMNSVKEGNDGRDLSKCIYLGDASANSPKNEIASFCIPEINLDPANNCTFMLCYKLADLKKHVQSYKSIGQPVPTMYYAELVRQFPSAVDTLGRDMSPEWVYVVEHYPNLDSVDAFVLGLIGMCYTFARDSVPVLGTMLRFTEGVANKVYEKTPERVKSMVKKLVKQGKVTLMTFAHNPLIVQGCIALSKFLRLVTCIYFSTTDKDGPTFLEVLMYSKSMLEPLARSNPIAAVVFSYVRTLSSVKDIALNARNLNVWGLFTSVFSLGGNALDAGVASYFGTSSMVLMLPYRIIMQQAKEFQDFQYGVGNFTSGMKQMFGSFGLMDKDLGYDLGQKLEQGSGYLRENVHDLITLLLIQTFPPKIINQFVTIVLGSMFGPSVVTAFQGLMMIVKKMFPGNKEPNIVMVLYKFASASASSGSSMLLNIYPFYELRLIALCTQEMLHWCTDVGRCALIKLRIKYNIMAEGLADPGVKCCMAEEVGRVRDTILNEHDKQEVKKKSGRLDELATKNSKVKSDLDDAKSELYQVESVLADEKTSPEEKDKALADKREIEARIQVLEEEESLIEDEKKDVLSFDSKFDLFKSELETNKRGGLKMFEAYLKSLVTVTLGSATFHGALQKVYGIIEAQRKTKAQGEAKKFARHGHNDFLYRLALFIQAEQLKSNQQYAAAVHKLITDVNDVVAKKATIDTVKKKYKIYKLLFERSESVDSSLASIFSKLKSESKSVEKRPFSFDDKTMRYAIVVRPISAKDIFDPNGTYTDPYEFVTSSVEMLDNLVKHPEKIELNEAAYKAYETFSIPSS
jgi:hypothetical protein